VAALLSGDVDFISPVPPQDFNRIEKDAKLKLVTYPAAASSPSSSTRSAVPNSGSSQSTPGHRHAVNNEGIVKRS
jgi:peptide/nickel transport system substrate-binding protein